MDKTQPDITSGAEAIEAAFGGRWGVWLSDTGWWWAARREPLNAAGLGAGCAPFLRAQTQAGLIECIQDQEDLGVRAAGAPQQARQRFPSQADGHSRQPPQRSSRPEGDNPVNSPHTARPHLAAGAVPCQLKPDTAHPARVYAYWLGSKHHYPADRAAAEEVTTHCPQVVTGARANRAFLARVVRYLASERGIRQFLDIGSGLPAPGNAHEVAQAIAPDCRVVYADNDPTIVAHARARLTSSPEGRCGYLLADLRHPDLVLREATRTLDLTRPAALVLAAVMHFIPDADDPAGMVAALSRGLAPGSFVAISHLTADFAPGQVLPGVAAYNSLVRGGIIARTHAQVTGLFGGMPLIFPGVVPVAEWRPATGCHSAPAADVYAGLAAITRRGRCDLAVPGSGQRRERA